MCCSKLTLSANYPTGSVNKCAAFTQQAKSDPLMRSMRYQQKKSSPYNVDWPEVWSRFYTDFSFRVLGPKKLECEMFTLFGLACKTCNPTLSNQIDNGEWKWSEIRKKEGGKKMSFFFSWLKVKEFRRCVFPEESVGKLIWASRVLIWPRIKSQEATVTS